MTRARGSFRLSSDLHFGVSGEVLQPYRRLAIRVLAQAFRDLRRGPPELRLSALEFLTDGTRLEMWCGLAEIGAGRVSARAMAQRCDLLPAGEPIQTVDAGAKLASAKSSVS
jgi:hypothetical protein